MQHRRFPAGRFYPLRDIISLPNVLNQDNWADKHMLWSDNTQRYMPIPSQYVSTRPVINKDVIDPSIYVRFPVIDPKGPLEQWLGY